jgi:hypothetical protein
MQFSVYGFSFLTQINLIHFNKQSILNTMMNHVKNMARIPRIGRFS